MKSGGKWNSRKGRINVEVRASRLGSDWCLLVTGGDLPHVGAVGWCGRDVQPVSLDFPEHRDRAVVDLFLAALFQVPGHHVVVAGIHLDRITRVEIDEVLELCRTLANRVAVALARDSA